MVREGEKYSSVLDPIMQNNNVNCSSSVGDNNSSQYDVGIAIESMTLANADVVNALSTISRPFWVRQNTNGNRNPDPLLHILAYRHITLYPWDVVDAYDGDGVLA
jgi:hypothetical protein